MKQHRNMSTRRNSGLLRFRSAPSSLFADGDEKSEIWASRFCFDDANKVWGLGNNDFSNDKSGDERNCALSSQFCTQYPWQSESAILSSIDSRSFTGESSSSAGLNYHPAAQNGYVTKKWIGRYGIASSDMPSSLGMLSRIAEFENSRTDDGKVESSYGHNTFYNSGLLFGSWNDSSNVCGHFTSVIKRESSNDGNVFFRNQEMEHGSKTHTLSHHLSLPKNSSKMPDLEKLMAIEDTVPCKIRAKRGCATHPRSIAERLRRTRISERIRKLQELVPNIDKQTNTADMLDLAVEHIKDLQKQYKKLSDHRAQCKCSPP